MRTFGVSLVLAALISVPALADDAVTLPSTAKLLTKSEIVAAYDGKRHTWSHPNTDKGTGTYTYDAARGEVTGTFKIGKDKGEFEGKIEFKDDLVCFKTRGKGKKTKYSPLKCVEVYLDGDTAYEIDPKTKVITSVNKPI